MQNTGVEYQVYQSSSAHHKSISWIARMALVQPESNLQNHLMLRTDLQQNLLQLRISNFRRTDLRMTSPEIRHSSSVNW